MNYLVGYTGFVGSNIYSNLLNKPNWLGFNRTNIHQAFSQSPDRLIYTGVQARKYWANDNHEEDFKIIEEALSNIRKICAKQTILISSIDVYSNPVQVDETSAIDTSLLQPYAYNRRWLEEAVLNEIPNSKVVRLPALYGINIKKNFIFDLIHFVPSVLTEEKFSTLVQKNFRINDFYELNSDNHFCLKNLTKEAYREAIQIFKDIDFSALHFTDSRAVYQFYPLKHLTKHLEIIFQQPQAIFNLATQGISVEEITKELGLTFTNHIHEHPIKYDFRTLYAQQLEGVESNYLFNKEYTKQDLTSFVLRYKKW